MPIPVTPAFLTAQAADGNAPISKVQLVLGNYFSALAYGTTVASSGDVSASYPAAGAIDGDRTEINIGPASGADNDIGLSSWRSSGVPDNGDVVTLTMTFSQSRTINRIKLYHLSGAGLKTYKLAYWNGSSFVQFAATADVASGSDVVINTTMQLDTIDFDDISTTKIKLTVTATQVAMDKANVVEIEAYRLVDVTTRVKGVTVTRQRDFKLGNPMATTVSLECINDDRFWSISHTPTSDEIASGFINSELQPGIGIEVSMGFDLFTEEPELAGLLVATVDRITIRPQSRDARIDGRDGMKVLINKIDSSKLKSVTDIGSIIQYVLNRSNISNYEMRIDLTSINIDYFFSDQQDVLSTIQDLVQAAGDSTFYFDEYGFAIFKFYSTVVPLQHVYTSNTDWTSGTLSGNMQADGDQLDLSNTGCGTGETNPASGSYQRILVFDGTFIQNPWHIGVPIIPGSGAVSGVSATISNIKLYTQLSLNLGVSTTTWYVKLFSDSGGVPGVELYSHSFSITSPGGTSGSTFVYNVNEDVSFAVTSGTKYWIVLEVLKIGATPQGRIQYVNAGTQDWSGGPYTYGSTSASSSWFVGQQSGGANVSSCAGSYTLSGVPVTGTWYSPGLDLGVSVTSLGILTDSNTPNGGTITYFTRTSPDNATWDAWVPLGPGNQIQSTVRRYMETRADMALTSNVLTSPVILDITVNWVAGIGSPKYPSAPSSFTYAFDSTLLDVQQELADNLGGDSAILNDVTVQAQPLVLTGTNADVVFQGTVGTPPSAISAGTPLAVTNGQTLTISPYIPGGMDVSRMSGANPPAAAITFAGGGAGSWVFSSIHPTLPVLVITITGTGNITNLQIQGKVFQAATYLQAQNSKDAASIATYGDRRLNIGNQWIVSASLAAFIASTIVTNSKSPTSYIPFFDVRPSFSAQIGDRVTIEDTNLDLSADYIIVGLSHTFAVRGNTADIRTRGTLLKVPAGS